MPKHQALQDGLALVFEGIRKLNVAFPNRKFTIDGRLVGDIGEVIAELEYDIILHDVSQPAYDGETSDGKRVQIKATFKNHLTFKTTPDYFLGFKLFPDGGYEEIYNGPGDLIYKKYATSCRASTGIDVLSETIRENLDAAKQERWARGAKAYTLQFLKEKKKACEKYVTYAAASSAANALNPVPGVDVAVDLGILTKLFAEIRADFGLDDNFLDNLKHSSVPAVSRLATNILKYATREGLMLLLKRFAGRTAVKAFSKYIPFVGQAVAAGLGYAITSNAGSSYLDDCYELAKEALDNKLGI